MALNHCNFQINGFNGTLLSIIIMVGLLLRLELLAMGFYECVWGDGVLMEGVPAFMIGIVIVNIGITIIFVALVVLEKGKEGHDGGEMNY